MDYTDIKKHYGGKTTPLSFHQPRHTRGDLNTINHTLENYWKWSKTNAFCVNNNDNDTNKNNKHRLTKHFGSYTVSFLKALVVKKRFVDAPFAQHVPVALRIRLIMNA